MTSKRRSQYTLIFQGTAPFGALLTGWLAERSGARGALSVSGAVCLAAVLAAWVFSRARSGREVPTTVPTRVAPGQR